MARCNIQIPEPALRAGLVQKIRPGILGSEQPPIIDQTPLNDMSLVPTWICVLYFYLWPLLTSVIHVQASTKLKLLLFAVIKYKEGTT